MRWTTGRIVSWMVSIVAAVWVLGTSATPALADAPNADDENNGEETSASAETGSDEPPSGEADAASDEDGGVPFQFRSVYLGGGTGFNFGIDFYLAEHHRIGLGGIAWLRPLITDCQFSCFRRHSLRLYWAGTFGSRRFNGGVIGGVARGSLYENESGNLEKGWFVGPLVGVRGSYTPFRGLGIGAHLTFTPSYYSGVLNEGNPDREREYTEFRPIVSAALVVELGSPIPPSL